MKENNMQSLPQGLQMLMPKQKDEIIHAVIMMRDCPFLSSKHRLCQVCQGRADRILEILGASAEHCDSLLQTSPGKPTWTTEQPTEVGWYWRRPETQWVGSAEVVRVTHLSIGSSKKVVWTTGSKHYNELSDSLGYEWQKVEGPE